MNTFCFVTQILKSQRLSSWIIGQLHHGAQMSRRSTHAVLGRSTDRQQGGKAISFTEHKTAIQNRLCVHISPCPAVTADK